MSEALVVLNAGSTSLKFGAYSVDAAGSLPLVCLGRIDSMQGDPHFVVKNAAGKPLDAHEWGEGHSIDHRTALHFVITWLEANLANTKVVAAEHRFVLGGTRFEAPVRIEGDVLDYLDSLTVMEPSHQPFNLRGARACLRLPVLIHRSIAACRRWRRPMRCRWMCVMPACGTGAITGSPTTTSAAKCRNSHPRHSG